MSYEVISKEEALDDLIARHAVIVVEGGVFGDESKGKVITAVANDPRVTMIGRWNGGQNAGHTIQLNGKQHVFHAIPSGILIPKKKKLCGPEMVIDPVTLVDEEIAGLQAAGIDYQHELVLDNFFIVTPYHKAMEAMRRENVSTLQGIAPAHASKVMKRGLRLDDLFLPPQAQREHIERDMEYFTALSAYRGLDAAALKDRLEKINEQRPGRIATHVIDFLAARDPVAYMIDLYQEKVVENEAFPRIHDTRRMLRLGLERGEKAVFEGSQSRFLSNAEATHWRSSTSADTSTAGIKAAAGYDQERFPSHTITVFKVPSSRVGLGANPAGYVPQDFFSSRGWNSMADLEGICDDFPAIRDQFFRWLETGRGETYKDPMRVVHIAEAMAIASAREHGEFGATSGKPRVCGFLDTVLANEAMQRTRGSVIISALDRYDTYPKVGLVTGYRVTTSTNPISRGKVYDEGELIEPGDEMPCENVLRHCQGEIALFPGWEKPIAGRTDLVELPEQLDSFLTQIAHHTGANIIAIGNGPRTEEMIYLRQRE